MSEKKSFYARFSLIMFIKIQFILQRKKKGLEVKGSFLFLATNAGHEKLLHVASLNDNSIETAEAF